MLCSQCERNVVLISAADSIQTLSEDGTGEPQEDGMTVLKTALLKIRPSKNQPIEDENKETEIAAADEDKKRNQMKEDFRVYVTMVCIIVIAGKTS